MSDGQIVPVRIDSALLSAQSRKRLYWTNIDNVTIPEDKGLVFNDIKDTTYDEALVIPEKYKPELRTDTLKRKRTSHRIGGYLKQGQGQRVYSMNGKSVCLSALGGGWGAKTGLYYDNGTIRKPTIKELCRLQTVPEDYFDNLDLSYNEIAKMLGNGWTIDVVAHLFKNLNNGF